MLMKLMVFIEKSKQGEKMCGYLATSANSEEWKPLLHSQHICFILCFNFKMCLLSIEEKRRNVSKSYIFDFELETQGG